MKTLDPVQQFVEAGDTPVEEYPATHGFSARLDKKARKHLAREEGAPKPFVDPQAHFDRVASLRRRAVRR